MFSPLWKPLILSAGKHPARAGGLRADTLQYFSVGTQSETFLRPPGITAVISMLRDIRRVQQRFGKRKLQHDLAGIIGHFEDRIHEAGFHGFGLEQFPDHGAGHFPGAIGIAQLLALGVGNQLVVDPRVEEISGHRSQPLPLQGARTGAGAISQVLYPGYAAPDRTGIRFRVCRPDNEPVDPNIVLTITRTKP